MSPSATMFRSARSVFRSPFFNPSSFTRSSARAGLRFQSTSSAAEPQVSYFRKMINSPVGFKTVHFWAPVMKWCLVLAGVSDFARPAEKLSLTQNGALTATGLIWTRWCLIIKPRNILLATVNAFLGLVGVIQCGRILSWRSSHKDETTTEQIKDVKNDVIEVAEGVKGDVKSALK